MDEYICRSSLRKAFENADADVVADYGDGACDWGFGRKNILEVINSVPAADVAPVRHGQWILVDTEKGIGVCSNCNRQDRIDHLATHCRFCGARMDLEVSDGKS